MLFNSVAFAIFLPIVFCLYWFVINKKLAWQNFLLLFASYIFYSTWNWKFTFLLAFSTFLDYYTGLKIYNAKTKAGKKAWLILSVGVNLSFLGFFKYYNFFIDSFAQLLQAFGFQAHVELLNIVLPVGISFYTFHGLSYVFDIYNDRIKPTTNWVNYTLFVSFFPLLVAGPIERARHLLPQVEKPRIFDYAKAADGLRQFLWGLVKKVIIADTCADYANLVFNHSDHYSGTSLVMGAVMFAFQIYGDFSGYSDMALGTARLFGFELLQNFSYPYFSRDIAEFWRRWHISLSSWFKDYLYIPLGGSKGGTWGRIRNTFIIFLVSGFWHGSNWTFIIWGGLNALFIMPSIIFRTNRNNLTIVAANRVFPTVKEFISMVVTFSLAVFAWIFFRATSVGHAFSYIKGIFTMELLQKPNPLTYSKVTLVFIVLFVIIEWLGRENKYALERINVMLPNKVVRWGAYLIITFTLLAFMADRTGKANEFIYFQF